MMNLLALCKVHDVIGRLDYEYCCAHHRSKTYQFDDFLTTWYNRLGVGQAGAEHTDMSVRLTRDVEKYQVRRCQCYSVTGCVLSLPSVQERNLGYAETESWLKSNIMTSASRIVHIAHILCTYFLRKQKLRDFFHYFSLLLFRSLRSGSVGLKR